MFKKEWAALLIVLFLVSINIAAAEENVNDALELSDGSDAIAVSNANEAIEVNGESDGANSLQDIMLNDGVDGRTLLQEDVVNEESGGDNLLQNGEVNDDSYEIYVGQNITADGEGTLDNPFATLNLACNNVSGQDKVTVYIQNGTYYMDSFLKFDANSLHIQGIGEVVIKNANNDGTDGVDCRKAFGLTSGSASFTMSNIIFDASNYTKGYQEDYAEEREIFGHIIPGHDYKFCFFPFLGNTTLGTFVNCSFIGFLTAYQPLNGLDYNSSFINCYFDTSDAGIFYPLTFNNYSAYGMKFNTIMEGSVHTFDNCIFNNNPPYITQVLYQANSYSINLNDCWFGKNQIPSKLLEGNVFLSRYAVFNVTERHISDNQFEIVGNLTWNGTADQDGMENFRPMTVQLIDDKGEIIATPDLVNGSFSVDYTSASTINDITVKLDKEAINLVFMSVDVSIDAPSIYYIGDDKSITINFTDKIISDVTITVYNGDNYNNVSSHYVNNESSLTFKIPADLKEGNYTIDVSVNDNHYYGFNSTVFEVSKVSSFSVVPISYPEDNKVGDTVPITVVLNDADGNIITDASGNLTIYVGVAQIPFNKTISAETVIDISGLVYGNNPILVVYSGDDKYVSKSSELFYIFADKVSDYNLAIELPEQNTVGDNVTLTVRLPEEISGENVIFIIDGEKIVKELENGVANHTINNISAGDHFVNAIFMGDSKYEMNYNSTTFSVLKIATSLSVDSITIKTDETAVINITLSQELNTDVYVEFGGKKEIVSLENGKGQLTVSKLKEGNYAIKAVYTGDDIYQSSSNDTATIEVSKVNIDDQANVSCNIPEGTTAPEFTLNLPNDASGEFKVTVDGDKTYNASLVGGSATVKVPDLTVGDHEILVSYSGDDVYAGFENATTLNVPKASIPGGENALVINTPADGSSPSYSINLPGATGNLTVTVDGKDSYTKELVNGSATVTLPELPAGKHSITVSYSGDEKFSAISKNSTVDVPVKAQPESQNKTVTTKKAATKITAKKKAFKAKVKVKKYTITLKSGKKAVKKVWVTLKIKGKKMIKAKTNAKGKAVFKIKKLTKKGKYTAVIKFKGNKSYKASSKKVKLTVK